MEGPIRPSGWALLLYASCFLWFVGMKRWSLLLVLSMIPLALVTGPSHVDAQSPPEQHHISATPTATHNAHGEHGGDGWEGSAEGKAYSEFNHHLAGVFDTLLGLAEVGNALQYPLPFWTRLVLPAALGTMGVYLFIWSDHDAWPIGTLSFVESFFGGNREIVEHKFYGVLALIMAVVEALRRTGKLHHPAWTAPLVFSILIAGLLLFVHSHGDHPGLAKIEVHHTLLGTVGVVAAFSKGMASWFPGASPRTVKRWEVAWAASVILFGLLLLAYSE